MVSDLETKFKTYNKYSRNIMAKTLRDRGDFKGAFALKIVDPRKGQYKRMKVRVTDLDDEE